MIIYELFSFLQTFKLTALLFSYHTVGNRKYIFFKKGTHRTYLYSVFFFGMFQVKFNHYVCLCTRLSRFSRHNAYTFLHQGESPDRDIRSLFCYKTDNCYTFVLIKDFYERKTFFTERIRAEIFAKMSVLRKVYCHDFVYD